MTRPGLTLLATVLISASLGSIHAFSVFIEPLERSLGAGRAEVSLLYSLATLCLTAAMLFGHVAFRRLAPVAVVMTVGAGAGAGLALAALGGSLPVVGLGYGVLFGLANGLGYGFCLQAAGRALPARKGFALGAVTSAYALGAVAFAKIFALLIAAGGTALAMGTMAGVLLAVALIAALLLGLSGATRLPPPPAGPAGVARGAAGDRARLFVLLWSGYGLCAAAGLMAIGHAAGIVAALGAGAGTWVLGAMLIGLGNALGGLLGGWATDIWPLRRMMAGIPLISALALFALAGVGSPLGAVAVLAVVGFAYGAAIAVYPVAVADYYGADHAAKAFGRVFTAWGLAGLGAPWLAGALFDASGSYHVALGLAGVGALLAAGTAAALPRPGPAPQPAE